MSTTRSIATTLAIATTCMATSGCRLVVELIETDSSESPAPEAGDDSVCAPWSYAPETFDPCAVPRSAGPLELTNGNWLYDTTSGVLTDPSQNTTMPTSALISAQGGIEARALSVDAFSIANSATLRIRGKQPLIIVSWSTADVSGLIDLTSHPSDAAAGSNPDACAPAAAGTGTDNTEGAGGGGGGGFGTNGGAGGNGDDGGAAGGRAGQADSSGTLRGGCRGGDGGNTLHGVGGDGGGAVVIATRNVLTLNGVIAAGGAGGGAAQGGRGGGGGGGSGGYVGLAGARVVLGPTAVVAANGGGGGGGSDGTPALAGQDGQSSATAATPGAGQGMGSSGGAGGALGTAPKPGIASHRGGGGGGGAVGVVHMVSPEPAVDTNAVISPPGS
jgi:hypothetical protein